MKVLSDKRRYQYYEASVQDPEAQIDLFEEVYKDEYGTIPLSLREDFCGTFALSCEWVKRGAKRTALGIDFDSSPLEFGKENNLARLTKRQQKAIKLKLADVRDIKGPKVDVGIACNFSFYSLKERKAMVEYFRAAHQGLKKKGAFVLEMVGGPGFEEVPFKESRSVYKSDKKKGKPWLKYTWQHKDFDPISRNGVYAINFRTAQGQTYKDAFVYDWRVWTIPEVKEALAEAGFKKSVVYWERENAEGEDEYERLDRADSDFDTWIAFVVGYKS